ncbi:hypothetical protein NG895_04340 [Aeoliella sp. ICT_H6.2]|uniref:WD40 repeat protein n=1 Tax=Aeoliella straminimaris TaxID=2954799 RepID=A0A9X2F6H3_9BACT|nr:hypothetical protein [Aeoliella straminimaris]MCO6043125.1 hypothetical protein [Aeoliella straminimaris]
MSFEKWMTWALVVVLTAAMSTASAKKRGNGNEGGGGDDGGGTTVPIVPGEIVFSDAVGSIEIKLDGTNEQPNLGPSGADPSNLSFAGGGRWYLTVKVSGTIPEFNEGEIVGTLQWQDVFAVNSLTGEEIQLTDLSADGLYVYEAKWSRDGNDSEIYLVTEDVSAALILFDGEVVLETTDYTNVPPVLLTLDVSALEIDVASKTMQIPAPATRLELLASNHAVSQVERVRDFAVSPDGTLGAYELEDFIIRDVFIFDVATGATLAILDGGRDPSWSPDGSKLVFATRTTVEVFDTETGLATVLQSEIKREQSNFWNPEFSPDGNYILYSSQHPQGKDISFEAQVINADGSQRVEVDSRFRGTVRWVAD